MNRLASLCMTALLATAGTIWAQEDKAALKAEMKEVTKKLGVIKKKLAADPELKALADKAAEAAKAAKTATQEAVKGNDEVVQLQAKAKEASDKARELKKAKGDKEEIKTASKAASDAKKELSTKMNAIMAESGALDKVKAAAVAKKAYNDALLAKLKEDAEAKPLLEKLDELKAKIKPPKKPKGDKKKGKKKKKPAEAEVE